MSISRNFSKPFCVIVVAFLILFSARSDDEIIDEISNCFLEHQYMSCTGNFNLSRILLNLLNTKYARVCGPMSNRDFGSICTLPSFKGLDIDDTDIEEMDERIIQFHRFTFNTILIENAPKLKYISPKALVELKDHLIDFRAINTGLPQYNDFGNDPHKKDNPFDDFERLREVYIGKQSSCPSDQALLFPCTCRYGGRDIRVVSSGSQSSTFDYFAQTTHVFCVKDVTGEKLKEIFESVSRSDHEPKHFDVLKIQSVKSLTDLPSNVFSDVSFTIVEMNDLRNLKSIHPKAFVSDTNDDRTARSIQILELANANFTAASSSELDDLFSALSSLTNIRSLRLIACGIPNIPPHAFTPENRQKKLYNLRHLALNELPIQHEGGIESVGSYAFSGAPKLIELNIEFNSVQVINSFAFAFNETSNIPLTIEIGGNPFNDSYGLKPNAFSGSQRPTRIIVGELGVAPSLDFIPENVFRPFIEENSENYFQCHFDWDVWCDCNSRWMFDDNGKLRQNIENGLRVNRFANNFVGSNRLSVQCKPDSTFDCLPGCLSFSSSKLIHCGGNEQFDVKSTLRQLGQSSGTETERFNKLLLSSKQMQHLPMNAFGDFRFEHIDLEGCWNLSAIHPDAFGDSTGTVTTFSAKNSNVKHLPNFASFPKLVEIRLDEYPTINLNSSNFDFSEPNLHPSRITVILSNGLIGPKTFTKLNNKTVVNLKIGEGVPVQCKPITYFFDEQTVATFLAANPQNIIQTDCDLECSCDLKWLCKSWNNVGSRIGLYYGLRHKQKFDCVPKGTKSLDVAKFTYGEYYKKNCCNKKSIQRQKEKTRNIA